MGVSRVELGVVVLDLSQRPFTVRCLKSLAAGSRLPHGVVLVENGSEDFRDLEEQLPQLRLKRIHSGRNLGCAGGRNRGANLLFKTSGASAVIFIDNDTIVPGDFLEKVCSYSPNGTTVYAPLVVNLTNGHIWSCGGAIAADGSVCRLTDLPSRDGAGYDVDWAPGVCLVIPRQAWEVTGKFDEWMNFLFEDIDWCYRLRQCGGKVVVLPGIRLLHEPSQSLGGEWGPPRIRLWARNGTVFVSCVLRRGIASYAAWFGREMYDLMLDCIHARPRWVVARMVGVSEGIAESLRRRIRVTAGQIELH